MRHCWDPPLPGTYIGCTNAQQFFHFSADFVQHLTLLGTLGGHVDQLTVYCWSWPPLAWRASIARSLIISATLGHMHIHPCITEFCEDQAELIQVSHSPWFAHRSTSNSAIASYSTASQPQTWLAARKPYTSGHTLALLFRLFLFFAAKPARHVGHCPEQKP